MGWDIHIVAEVYDEGNWQLSDVEVPSDRNYWAFAVLADVCNGYGFAGTDKGDPIEPIRFPGPDAGTEMNCRHAVPAAAIRLAQRHAPVMTADNP